DEYPHSGRLTRNRYLESSGDVPYYGFETMDVELGDGSGGQVYALDIDGVNIPLLSVRGGAGADSVIVRQLAANELATHIQLGGEDDVLRIINSQRQLVVSGGQNLSNGDRLIVDHTNDPVSREGSVAADVLFGFGNSVIRYDNFEFLDIELGSGTDRVTVADTNSLTSTTLRGGEGDDQFLIQTISSETTIVGGPGEDLATLLIPGNPNLLTADDYGDLRLTVERLQIDNREYGSTGVVQPVAWAFENNDVFVSTTKILESVAADTVIFLGGQGSNDQLTVRDSVAVPQTVTVDGSRVTIEEGFNVLSFDQQREFSRFNVAPTVDGLDGVTATVISPDGQYVYASSAVDDAVSVYRVTADPANPIINALDFVQVLKNGQLGVSGIDAASDIAISSNGTHVYVASGSTQSIGVFERLPQNGRLVYRGAYSGGLGAIRGIAVAPNGENLFGITATHLFRLARNPQTGLLSIGDSRAFANANAIAADNQNVFLAAASKLSHWRLGLDGTLQTETDSFARNYTDVSLDSANRRVFATFDGGVSEFSFSASGLGAPRDQAYINPINKTQGLVVEYDADDQRLVTSFDSNSVDPNP
ncbi:MAG: lactonase family protein, partial [bacterium]|nr:lactonase family protein [bacterium]